MDIDPLELARQLTLVEADLFVNIKSREFIDLAWMKNDKTQRAPNIVRMTQWSNHVVQWLVTEIVNARESTKARAQCMEKIILLGQNLEKLQNFNGVKEVVAALQSSAVYRLKKTKQLVGGKLMKTQEDLIKLTSSELNYKIFRGRIQSSTPPLIPFPGLYQGDLVRLSFWHF